jgi:hypothetical protein
MAVLKEIVDFLLLMPVLKIKARGREVKGATSARAQGKSERTGSKGGD